MLTASQLEAENCAKYGCYFTCCAGGEIKLGLGDVAYKVESLLEGLGCLIRYTGNYCIATAYLAPEA